MTFLSHSIYTHIYDLINSLFNKVYIYLLLQKSFIISYKAKINMFVNFYTNRFIKPATILNNT